jgi:lysophospholipase L1-like esterase
MRARRAIAVASGLFTALVFGALTASAGAAPRPITRPLVVPGSQYLALGDSVTFGYREATTVPAPNYRDPSSFIGYPQLVGAALRLKVANAACSGETSSSLINVTAGSNGCENHPPPITTPTEQYRTYFPLHVSYRGSQLRFAMKYLRSHRNVRLVSLMIGANDVFRCEETTKDGCLSSAEQQSVETTVASNVRLILSSIRNRAHYRGQLVIVNYYSLDYSNALINGVIGALNGAVDTAAKPFRVLIANGYGQFYQGSLHSGANPCTAGLLTLLALAVQRAIHL